MRGARIRRPVNTSLIQTKMVRTDFQKNADSQEWFGHQDAQKTYHYRAPPTDVKFEGHTFELKTYSQLEGQSKRNLHDRCTMIRDKLGANRLPSFNPSGDRDAHIRWILEVEVAICNACTGQSFTFFDFGVPEDYSVQRPSIGNKPTMKSMTYKGLQEASPFAADYSEQSSQYRPNSAVKHVQEQRDNIENLPQWARERHVTTQKSSFGGNGILAAMMQAQLDSSAGADVARRRNMASNVF